MASFLTSHFGELVGGWSERKGKEIFGESRSTHHGDMVSYSFAKYINTFFSLARSPALVLSGRLRDGDYLGS